VGALDFAGDSVSDLDQVRVSVLFLAVLHGVHRGHVVVILLTNACALGVARVRSAGA